MLMARKRFKKPRGLARVPGAPDQPDTERHAMSKGERERQGDDSSGREAEIRRRAEAETLRHLNEDVNPYDGSPLRFPFQVAPRKRLRSRIGELSPGAQVTAELVGGTEELRALIDRGVVLRAPVAA